MILSRSSRVRWETNTPCHTYVSFICLSSAKIKDIASPLRSRSAAFTEILKAKSLRLSWSACRTNRRLISTRVAFILLRVNNTSDVARAEIRLDTRIFWRLEDCAGVVAVEGSINLSSQWSARSSRELAMVVESSGTKCVPVLIASWVELARKHSTLSMARSRRRQRHFLDGLVR